MIEAFIETLEPHDNKPEVMAKTTMSDAKQNLIKKPHSEQLPAAGPPTPPVMFQPAAPPATASGYLDYLRPFRWTYSK